MSTKPHVKICCISSVAEAELAMRYGARALGLVGPMPSGPGIISDELIAEIAAIIPPGVKTFLLTSETSVEKIIAHHRRVGTTTIQLVDDLQQGSYADLREALPGVEIVQVLHVLGEESLEQAKRLDGQVDAILLDSGNPNLAVKELGGTGRTHNWEISRRIVEAVEIPVYLAGGLKAKNVSKAKEQVGSFGLDLCSGVRSNGHLDEAKLSAFFAAVNA